MKRLAVTLLALFGGFFLLLLFAFALLIFAAGGKPPLPAKILLEANLEHSAIEDVPDDPAAKIMLEQTPVIRDLVEALEKGSTDSRVAGLVGRFGGSSLSLAQAQEIRDAVTRFRAKGKFAVAYSETFGEFGPASGSYYLATGFEQIWLQPSGDVGLTGVIMESPFIKGTLDKLGVKPRMDHRYEYKNAMNFYTETKFTAAHREAMEKVKNSWFDQMVRGIAAGRKLKPEEVRALVDRGPFLGKEAVDARLVDGLAYKDEVYSKVKQRAGAGAQTLSLKKYLDRAGRPHDHGPVIALIYGAGAVTRGRSNFNPMNEDFTMGSDTVTAAFRSAIEDSRVKAILFRVDSPGGSYVASDAIWQQTVAARKAGKPVIVSMSTLAGSGGYFVAMDATKIVAQPGTITGSIGVLGGKMLTNGLWQKLGISFDEVHSGEPSTMFSSTHDFTPHQWARFQAWLDRVYTDFTGKVAAGRKLSKEKVLEIAKGRIWTGEDAKAIGLVDELGGFPTALAAAKKAAGIAESEEIKLVEFPQPKTTFQAIMDRINGEERDTQTASETALMSALQAVRPIARQLKSLSVQGVLSMPVFEMR
jgi:protease-4